ncbi:unnamed protein product [Acidithrix sp. C25]|nr:unnamed protein product [Acidithrix sp. C25]
MLATVATHGSFGFTMFFYPSYVTNYECGGVVVNDVIGRLVGHLMVKVTK